MWRKTETGVEITLTAEQYACLMWLLGFSTAQALEEKGMTADECLAVVNAVSEGDPQFHPYPAKEPNWTQPPGARHRKALVQSHHLLRHYAELLNMHDGGKRLIPESLEEWIERCNPPAPAAAAPPGRDRDGE